MITLASIGLLTLARYPLSLFRLIISFSPLPDSNKISLDYLRKTQSKSGKPLPPWALITGPTGDIGKAFAHELAKKGFSLVLVGRNETKLADLAQSIEQATPGTITHTLLLDLASPSESDWQRIKNEIEGLTDRAPISILINNAGVSHSQPVPFESTPLDEIRSINTVNILGPVRLTQIILPHMLTNRRGMILNIGSFSSLVPTPYLATYAGSKAFLYTWSQALGTELEPKGIQVRLLNTYFVASEMSKIRRPTFLIPSAPNYVRSVLDHLGKNGGAIGKPFVSTGYFSHALVEYLIDRVANLKFWLNYNLKLQKSILKRVEAKKRRELENQKKQ